MKTLRVRLDAPPDPARAAPWALADSSGATLASGTDPPTRWPAADRRVAVLAADAVRVVALPLPPMPAARLAAAARFALEDRLATPLDDAVVAVGSRRGSEPVIVVVVERTLAAALARAEPPFDRAIAEPLLASPDPGWGWFAGEAGGFVRDAAGGAFAVGHGAGTALPAELAVALQQSARAGTAPEQVVVHRRTGEEELAAWTRASGVPFVSGAPWHWATAGAAAFEGAIDVLGPARSAARTPSARRPSLLPTAVTLAVLAGTLHVAATAGTWAWQRFDLARSQRELDGIARALGGTRAADIARLHAEARHRSGRAAPDDAMPLLARAAPALAALPAGALRTASYAQGAWTIDLAKVDEPALAALRDRAAQAGLAVVHAPTASGARARIAAAP